MFAGPSNCSALLQHSSALRNLQCLDLTFPNNGTELESAGEIGDRIGKQLVQLMVTLRLLKQLMLNFDSSGSGRTAVRELAQAPPLPQFRRIDLADTYLEYSDWVTFVAKHKASIVKFELRSVRFDSESFADIRQGFSRLLACTKLKWMTFFLSHVCAWNERIVKQLNLPTCREFYDDGYNELWYGCEPYEAAGNDGTDNAELEDWVAVDTRVDWFQVGGEEYVQESLFGFIECFGGLPWAD